MGNGDNRRTRKMKRARAQRRFKARIKKRMTAGKSGGVTKAAAAKKKPTLGGSAETSATIRRTTSEE